MVPAGAVVAVGLIALAFGVVLLFRKNSPPKQNPEREDQRG
jgi:hypothetical protein